MEFQIFLDAVLVKTWRLFSLSPIAENTKPIIKLEAYGSADKNPLWKFEKIYILELTSD